MAPVLRLGAQRLCMLTVSCPVLKPQSPLALLRQLHSSRHVSAQPGRGDPRETTSQMLDRMAREARERRAADPDRDYVGPIPLGVGADARRRTWKSWSELNASGKIGRTFAQSGNLLIVLVGGGLAVIIAIALSTELFAKNSPSVLYSECIDMIRDTDVLDKHLLPPMTFTHSQHASAPTRGSAPVVHRMIRNPASGRDHMLLTFWVHGRGKDEPEPLGWAKTWVKKGEEVVRQIGSWVGLAADPDGPVVVLPPTPEPEVQPEQQGPGFLGRLARSFSLSSGSTVKSATAKPPPPGTYKIGEVRADYVKNASGHFTMLALVIDVPSSRAAYPGRVTVFWSPEANRESLINRR